MRPLPPHHHRRPDPQRRVGPPPTERIGDAERSRTCELLQSHFGAGRLEMDELDDRLGAAMRAKTHGDLRATLADLPRVAPLPAAADRIPRSPIGALLDVFGTISVVAGFSIIGLMLLGSLFLGSGVFIFSLIGGSLAAYVSGVAVWLLMRDRRWLPGPPQRLP